MYRTLAEELRKMMGAELYEQVARYLDGRERSQAPPVRHPAEVPVRFTGRHS